MPNIRSKFNENGFYVAKNIIDTSFIEAIKEEILFIVNQQLSLLSIQSTTSLEAGLTSLHSANISRYLKALRCINRLNSIQKIFTSEAITSLLANLNIEKATVPTGPVFHIMSEALKIPNGYYGLKPHQDWPSMQGSLDSIIIWLPLVDIKRNMNPLEVIPSSHLKGLYPFEIGENEGVIADKNIEEDFQPVLVDAGDAVALSAFTVHKSSLQGSNGIRMACSIRFENLEEDNYIERGYPTAYQRTVHRENMGFEPSLKNINKIYNPHSTSKKEPNCE